MNLRSGWQSWPVVSLTGSSLSLRLGCQLHLGLQPRLDHRLCSGPHPRLCQLLGRSPTLPPSPLLPLEHQAHECNSNTCCLHGQPRRAQATFGCSPASIPFSPSALTTYRSLDQHVRLNLGYTACRRCIERGYPFPCGQRWFHFHPTQARVW